MIVFVSLTKMKAIRKALDYWYKNFYGKYHSSNFIKNCTWVKINLDYIVIYKGPES